MKGQAIVIGLALSLLVGCESVGVYHCPPPPRSHVVVETWHEPYLPVPKLEVHLDHRRPHHALPQPHRVKHAAPKPPPPPVARKGHRPATPPPPPRR